MTVITAVQPGWWTSVHVLAFLNGVLATAAVITAMVGVKAIRASNRLADGAELETEEVRKQAEAVAAQIELERRSLNASIQALVVNVPPNLYVTEQKEISPHVIRGRTDKGTLVVYVQSDGTVSVWVPMRNIGRGPAFVHDAMITTGPGNTWRGFTSTAVLPVDEPAYVGVDLSTEDPLYAVLRAVVLGDHGAGIAASLRYTDMAGEQRTQTVITLGRLEGENEVSVVKVELFRCGPSWGREGPAFVTSTPGLVR